jgi:hypothetical protein
MTEGIEQCERCRRVAPSWEADEYVTWEATERADGSVVGIICPGCLTLGEENAIAADMEQLAADTEETATPRGERWLMTAQQRRELEQALKARGRSEEPSA